MSARNGGKCGSGARVAIDGDAAGGTVSGGLGQRLDGRGHRGMHGFGGLGSLKPEASVGLRDEEVNLKALRVAKVLGLLALVAVNLALKNLGRDKSLEDGAEKGRAAELGRHTERRAVGRPDQRLPNRLSAI